MGYIVTPVLGLQEADPATIQLFETPVFNANLNAIDTAIGNDRGRLTPLENAAVKSVTDLDALILNSASAFRGRIIYVANLAANFQSNGTIWVQATVATVATTTIRDTEYAKASGQFKVAGASVVDSSTGIRYIWSTLGTPAWKAWESDWTAYTTTWTGTTETGSVTTFFWRYLEGDVDFEMRRTAGSGANITSANTFSLPVAMNARITGFENVGIGGILIGGGTLYVLTAFKISSTTLRLGAYAAGSYTSVVGVTNSIPGTPTSGTEVYAIKGRYAA